jgi:uncharacterized protein YqiB (DUF1249 family)
MIRWLSGPAMMRRLNGWAAVFWVAMIPVSYALHWLSSVTYVSGLSIWALVSGHLSTWQSARVEVRQEKDADVQEVLDEVGKLVTDKDHDGR